MFYHIKYIDIECLTRMIFFIYLFCDTAIYGICYAYYWFEDSRVFRGCNKISWTTASMITNMEEKNASM
jgi:hypothetical protein